MSDDKYTIDPFGYILALGTGYFKAGDLIDMLTGATIVGAYCAWPKQEPRYFIIEGGRQRGKTAAMELVHDFINIEPPKAFIDQKVIFKENQEGKVKFYQTLNRNKW